MKRRYTFSALALLALAMQAAAAPAPGAGKLSDAEFVPFEVLVKFKPQTQMAMVKAQLPDVAISSRSPHYSIAKQHVPVPKLYTPAQARAETFALLERMLRRSDVEAAQLNYYAKFAFVPNDPLYLQQWHYPMISLPTAWDITRGSTLVRIAILDSGRTGHTDLAGRFLGLEFNAPVPGTPATDNGIYRHGTHVAGIAGAVSNNGIGGAGVCQGCTMMNAKIGDTTTGLTMPWIIDSIDWATDNGARVINMSFESSQPCTTTNNPLLRAAVVRAVNNGVIVVAAAGNAGANVDTTSPASCPGVISVAAVDRNGNLAAYSNRGPNIGITAPGGGGELRILPSGFADPTSSVYGNTVNGTCPTNSPSEAYNNNDFGAVSSWTSAPNSTPANVHCYRHLSGTSMAAPHLSGTVGLMLSVNSGLLPVHVSSLIRSTATALPACGSNCGPGLLNAFAAVNNARVTATGPCSLADKASKRCKIDSIGQYVDANGNLSESVYAYGHLWKFDVSGNRLVNTKRLDAYPRYASNGGPCTFAPAGQDCTIDSSTIIDYPGFGYLESVTAYGRYWNFDINNNGLAGNGSLLVSVPRFANGPCLYASGGTCKFDTRNLIYAPEWGLDGLFESITAYGRYWIFDGAGNLVYTDTLLSVARFASGPCAYASAGTTCTFDSRELRRVPGSGLMETITAYGRYFEWDVNGNPTANHGQLLTNIARMR